MKLYKRQIILLLIISLLVIVGIGGATWLLQQNASDKSSRTSLPSLVNEHALDQLATTHAPIDRSHLASHLTPPTNKWFSGFSLQAQPKPGYNYPNSFLPTSSGFEFSLPKIQTTATSISGVHRPDVAVSIDGAANYQLTNYDELVIELTYYNADNKAIAQVHVASGLPYVYVHALQDVVLRFNGTVSAEDSWTRIKRDSGHYGTSAVIENNSFTLNQDSHTSFFSAPSETALSTVAQYAEAFVASGSVSYTRKDDRFTTTLNYETKDNQPVLFARLPHQYTEASSAVTYQSILGNMPTEVGTAFSFETPVVPIVEKLQISDISDKERDVLSRQLARDVDIFENHTDTYFGGKQLYRMAQLLIIANQLNEHDAANTAQSILRRELGLWLQPGRKEPKSFTYDPSMRGIVGNEASFGSDKEFNDHHFHYGYFIYAAAVLAEYDKDFLATHQKTVNLLVADIANYNNNEKLPFRRSFDPYAGHSWASGTAPFLDGNNQESTSEAINAWVGTSLWARQTNNDALELQANWMLSQEYHTAQLYWLMQQEDTPRYLSKYNSPLASIIWGGKREYSTFFSDAPNAKLAIQLLPLSPTMKRNNSPLSHDLLQGTSTTQTYGDTIFMATPNTTLEEAIRLPDTAIDDGNSRTYLYAYILAN